MPGTPPQYGAVKQSDADADPVGSLARHVDQRQDMVGGEGQLLDARAAERVGGGVQDRQPNAPARS
jgi:hypothetical protein